MINLTKAPFFLVKEDIEWVENTKKAMTLEEKIGQLFVPIGYSGDADYLEHVMLSHHIGGIMITGKIIYACKNVLIHFIAAIPW